MTTSVEDRLDAFVDQLTSTGCRGLLLLTGADAWVTDVAVSLLDDLSSDEALLVSNRELGTLIPTERRLVLGAECELLIWDLSARPDINTLAASAGCLRRGGLLLALAPEPDEWERYFCCDDGSPSLFWQHILRCFEQWPYLCHLSEYDGLLLPENDFPILPEDTELPTGDQLEAMTRVRRVLHGHRRRPLVIRADRGRGKTALLGLSAAEFLQENQGNVVVTAPRRDAFSAGLEQAAQVLGKKEAWPLTYGDSSLQFYAPDRLLNEYPDARIVLVDEAAAIPSAILSEIVKRYSRVVFATTVHGYEGSGKGFDIRFADELNALTPQWQRFELLQPIRWNEGDPLESLINRCFLSDAEPADTQEGSVDEIQVDYIDRLELFSDEVLLRDVFALLVSAHYQTAPSDLVQLLDSLACSLFLARTESGALVGAALTIEEGGLPDEWLDAVQQGERRLQGHLLPQSLTYHAGLDSGLSLRCARISRVAVREDFRRMGIGHLMLAEVENQARRDGLDYVGSSFAADDKVVPFWLSAEYLPLRLGVRRDPCSGSHALLVGKPLSATATQALGQVFERFSRYFPLELRETFQLLDSRLALTLLSARDRGTAPDQDVRRDVQRFANGEIGYEHASPALYLFLMYWQGPEFALNTELELAVQKVFQAKSWSLLVQLSGLRGRADVEHLIRQAFRWMLSVER